MHFSVTSADRKASDEKFHDDIVDALTSEKTVGAAATGKAMGGTNPGCRFGHPGFYRVGMIFASFAAYLFLEIKWAKS